MTPDCRPPAGFVTVPAEMSTAQAVAALVEALEAVAAGPQYDFGAMTTQDDINETCQEWASDVGAKARAALAAYKEAGR